MSKRSGLRSPAWARGVQKVERNMCMTVSASTPAPGLSPLLLPRGNLLPNLTATDMKTCRFHPDKAPFCPILRVGDVVKFAGQDFARLASTVSS